MLCSSAVATKYALLTAARWFAQTSASEAVHAVDFTPSEQMDMTDDQRRCSKIVARGYLGSF